MQTSLNFHRPNPLEVILALLFGTAIAVMINACVVDWGGTYQDHYDEHVSQPLCIPAEVIHPDFVTTWIRIPDPAYVEFRAGQYKTTLYIDQPGKIDSIRSVLSHFAPQWSYTVYLTDWFAPVIVVDGTNDHSIFQGHVSCFTPGILWLPAFTTQGAHFGGLLTLAEYHDFVTLRPSIARFDMYMLASTEHERDSLSLAIAGECNIGRGWADFRWGTVSDTIPPLFVARGWDQVLDFTSPITRAAPGEIKWVTTDEEAQYWLKQGYTTAMRL